MTKSRDVMLFFGGMLWQQAVTFVSGVVVARWLGPHDYGVLSIVRNIFVVALILAPLGLDLSLLRHLSERDDVAKSMAQVRRLRMIVAAVNVTVVAIMFFLLGPFFETHVYHQAGLGLFLALTFAALPFAADTQVLTAVFRARGRPAFQVIASLYIQPLARVLALIGLGVLGFGLGGVITATAIGYLASSLTMSVALRRINRTDGVVSRRLERHEAAEIRGVFNYSVWLAAMLLTYGLLRNIDILILARFRPPGEVGEYAALSAIAQVIQIYPLALSQTLGPTIARLYRMSDFEGIRRELNDYLRKASLLASPIFGAVAVFGPWLDLLFGPKYHFHPWLSLNLAAAFLISALFNPMGFPLSMTGRHKPEFVVLLIGTVGAIALCLVLAPRLGANGVALGTSAGYLFINFARTALTSRFLGIVPGGVRDILPPVLCIAVAFVLKRVADMMLQREALTALGVGVVYGLILCLAYWLVVLNEGEKTFIRSKVAKFLVRRPRLSA